MVRNFNVSVNKCVWRWKDAQWSAITTLGQNLSLVPSTPIASIHSLLKLHSAQADLMPPCFCGHCIVHSHIHTYTDKDKVNL